MSKTAWIVIILFVLAWFFGVFAWAIRWVSGFFASKTSSAMTSGAEVGASGV